MFKRNNTVPLEIIDDPHSQFRKLCQLCSPNFNKEEVLASEIDWPAVWKLALRHRVVPVMADRIKQLGIAVPENIAGLIADNVQQNLYKGMKQAAELVRLTKLFDEHDIPFVVFKGIALLKLMGLKLHQRHHGDIDVLLADVEDVKKADKVLRGIGYQRVTLAQNFSLNKYQERHFRHYEKDVIYYHPQRSIQLELHFKLCLSNKLLAIPAKSFHQRRANVFINSTNIPVMSKVDHQVYLLVHGAVSRWFRLKWLCDVPLASDNGKAYLSADFTKQVQQLGIERMVTLGLCLAQSLLAMPLSQEVTQHQSQGKYIQWAMSIVQTNLSDSATAEMNLAAKIKFWFTFFLVYMPLLKKDHAYKVDHFKSYFTRMSDWEVFPLPEYLFFLYYPLRPFLWLKRQL